MTSDVSLDVDLDRRRAPAGPNGHLAEIEILMGAVQQGLCARWAGPASLLEEMCHYALVPTGKLFRPMLLVESALAVGGSVDMVLPAAVGAECGHVASLIHDDIIDQDEMRRGRSSVQHKYGAADAIVAGDALIFDLFLGLAECRNTGVAEPGIVAALDAVARAGLDLCRGQSLEAEMCRGLRLDEATYITMVRQKTAAYFRGACESGALLGGGAVEQVDALAQYGDHLGVAFQIHDDLLPYLSDSTTTGKPSTSDIRNGRLTLPIILAYQASDALERQVIRATLSGAGDGACDVDEALTWFAALLDRTGAVAASVEVARRHALAARDALLALPATPSRDRLDWLADVVLERNR